MGTPSHQPESVAFESLCETSQIKSIKMAVDKEEILRICDIYDWHGKGELDMYYFIDIFYALGMNLTKKTTVKFGQTDDVEKAYKKFDEVVALVQQAVKEPEHTGNYFDYVELCKLYDKNENGTMMLAELEAFFSLMGDEIPKDDCTKLLDELADPEDEDGFFPYTPFLDKLCGKAIMPRPTTICYQNQKTNNSKLTKTTKIQTAQNQCQQHPFIQKKMDWKTSKKYGNWKQ